jgi:short-subunit dehydrogenase
VRGEGSRSLGWGLVPVVKTAPPHEGNGAHEQVRARHRGLLRDRQGFAQRLAADGYDLIVTGRRLDRLEELAATTTGVKVQPPTMLSRAAVPGMVARGEGTIINVSGMIAFSGPVPQAQLPLCRAVYTGTLAHLVAMTQTLHEELKSAGLKLQVLCPGVVATEFHERQGLDLSAVPRMSAPDVVTASLRGLELGEGVCAPGVEDASDLEAVFQADLAALGAQSTELAKRYQAS